MRGPMRRDHGMASGPSGGRQTAPVARLAALAVVLMNLAASSGAAAEQPRPAQATAMMNGAPNASGGTARPLGRGAVTGLPLPRFASLRSDPVNMRKGPGTEYPLALVYQRAGLPVEIMQEFEGWRQVRDWDGTTGWVLGALLSGRRTAIVQPWPDKGARQGAERNIPLYAAKRATGDLVAMLEPGTVASMKSCDGTWCDVTVAAFRGYLEQGRLWGVYPGEKVR